MAIREIGNEIYFSDVIDQEVLDKMDKETLDTVLSILTKAGY
jgi:hypothetical protein